MEPLNYELILRQDTAKVVEFLSVIVTALAAEETLAPKDLDDLRLSIRSLKPSGKLNQSALLVMAQEKSETLYLIKQRFGAAGLAVNLFRLTLRKPLYDVKKSLCLFGAELLQKTQLYFNRPFLVQHEGVSDYQTLLSSVLVELAKQIGTFVDRLNEHEETLHAMRPAQFGDSITDQRISEALGFDTVTLDALPLQKERRLKSVLAEETKNLSHTLSLFLQHLPQDVKESAALDWLVETLLEEGTRLDHWQLDHAHHWERWEWRRLSFIQTVNQLAALCTQISEAFTSILPKLAEETRHPVLTGAMEREIVFTMMVKGVSSKEANMAATALRQYCQNHQLGPDKLIAAELPKIHPLLLEEYFTNLGRAAREHTLSPSAQAEKERLLSVRQNLSQNFSRILSAGATALAIMLCMNITGCGLKGAPRSEIEDFRPSIQFHEEGENPRPRKNQKPAAPQEGALEEKAREQ